MSCLPSIPDFQIPVSSNVVGLSIIDSSAYLRMPLSYFIGDQIPGFEELIAPAYSFLIEHPSSGEKVLFDLGLRPDVENLPPAVLAPFWELIENGSVVLSAEKDVATILEDGGLSLDDINAIIWSHTHLDHVGDPSTFPNSTALVVGPGFHDIFVPGYPANPEGQILESDYAGREIQEISFADSFNIGRFQAVDYFGDGSFYLLDAPGHAFGHMAGLARTTPDTFILLGADTFHHGGAVRPTPYLPLPKTIKPSPFSEPPFLPGTKFPGHVLVDQVHPYHSPVQPFLQNYTEGADRNVTLIVDSVGKMSEFDARDDVFIVIAHDASILDVVDVFPKRANAWKEKGWKEESQWRFLADYKAALTNSTD